jgi:hypothetical protein
VVRTILRTNCPLRVYRSFHAGSACADACNRDRLQKHLPISIKRVGSVAPKPKPKRSHSDLHSSAPCPADRLERKELANATIRSR